MDSDDDMIIVGEAETFDPSLKNDKEYIKKMLDKYKPGIYGSDAPKSMNNNFYLYEIYDCDSVKWFEYYYNKLNFNGTKTTLLPHDIYRDNVDMVNYACQFDAINCLKFLISKYRLPSQTTCDICVEFNSSKCLNFLFELGYRCKYTNVVGNVCKHETNECLELLLNQGYEITNDSMSTAIKSNSIECINTLCEHGVNILFTDVTLCIDRNNIEILKIFARHGYKYNAFHMAYALIKKSYCCTAYFDDLRQSEQLYGDWVLCL